MQKGSYESLIQKFIRWAEGEPAIRAAVVVGSQARCDHPADEWSDLDVIVFSQDAKGMIADSAWLDQLGKVVLMFVEINPSGDEERRVLFENGLDVDFNAMQVEKVAAMLNGEISPSLGRELLNAFGRGMRVLVDKDGLLAHLSQLLAGLQAPPPELPTEKAFLNLVNDFWYHAIWTARHLRRGELWWAKGCCDGYLKWLLFQVLEWQARLGQGMDHDTWFRGRFLEQWADRRALQELPEIYAHYDVEDVWRSLQATMKLFQWLSIEIAGWQGFAYPQAGAEFALREVSELFQEYKKLGEVSSSG